MAGFTDYLEDKVVNHLFGGTAYTAPTTWYCGLLTAAPTDSTSGTEVSGGSYARQAISWTVTGSGTAQAASSAALTWPAATTDWGTATHAAVYDALTGGNICAYETLTQSDFSTANPKIISTGDIFKIDSGNLKVQLD
ncbi:MAG: hypothetical protein HOE64_17250 [Nitrospina sp.]|jgi:hypothetical protein|nr:hypothetical protein [Nitrospina sp.]